MTYHIKLVEYGKSYTADRTCHFIYSWQNMPFHIQLAEHDTCVQLTEHDTCVQLTEHGMSYTAGRT